MMKHIALILILFGALTLQAAAQSFIKNDKIPDDLNITLKRTGRFEDYVITVEANGNWSFKGYAGLPVQNPSAGILLNGGKTAQKIDATKAKLNAETLRSLVSEFEKIQFFKFGKDFPPEDYETRTSISDQSTETISIRLNGRTKEVSNYLGDSGKRAALLRDLAERIRAVKIWNLENGRIPQDLSITYRDSRGEGWTELVIESDGRVRLKYYSNMPASRNFQALFNTKEPKLKDKLSKKQLEQLISSFESIGFSAFANKTLGEQDGCTSGNVSAPGRSKLISVQINHRNMYASADEGCNPRAGTNAAKFEQMVLHIEETLKNVKAAKMN